MMCMMSVLLQYDVLLLIVLYLILLPSDPLAYLQDSDGESTLCVAYEQVKDMAYIQSYSNSNNGR